MIHLIKKNCITEGNKSFLFMNIIMASFANLQNSIVLCGLQKGACGIKESHKYFMLCV